MYTPAGFTPLHAMPEALGADAMAFAFRDGKILVGGTEDAPAIPAFATLVASGVVGTPHFLANLNATSCIAVWLPDDAPEPAQLRKKGLALTPVKFGISFTTTHLNQAGALVLVYADGSIHLNHGGTEMGQGLMIKVAQVVADVFARADREREDQRDPHRQGPQHLGHRRLLGRRPERHGREERRRDDPRSGLDALRRGRSRAPRSWSFAELCRRAHLARISLAATGFYATPKIHYDRDTHIAAGPSSISLMARRSAKS